MQILILDARRFYSRNVCARIIGVSIGDGNIESQAATLKWEWTNSFWIFSWAFSRRFSFSCENNYYSSSRSVVRRRKRVRERRFIGEWGRDARLWIWNWSLLALRWMTFSSSLHRRRRKEERRERERFKVLRIRLIILTLVNGRRWIISTIPPENAIIMSASFIHAARPRYL